MIEKICDKDTWQILKESRKPIVLYGMGNGADQIIEVLNGYGLDFADVFASDGFVRGQLFHGKKVLTLNEGDSIYFDSTQPHGMRALNNETVKFLAIIF